MKKKDERIKLVDKKKYKNNEKKGRRIMKDEIKDKGVKKNIEGKGKGKIDGLVDEM